MTDVQKEALSRRDFGRLTATGLGAFAFSDVLIRVFGIQNSTAFGCPSCDTCNTPCDACQCEGCDQGCDPECDGCPCDGPCEGCDGCEEF